jgi:hypothetical protein
VAGHLKLGLPRSTGFSISLWRQKGINLSLELDDRFSISFLFLLSDCDM